MPNPFSTLKVYFSHSVNNTFQFNYGIIKLIILYRITKLEPCFQRDSCRSFLYYPILLFLTPLHLRPSPFPFPFARSILPSLPKPIYSHNHSVTQVICLLIDSRSVFLPTFPLLILLNYPMLKIVK